MVVGVTLDARTAATPGTRRSASVCFPELDGTRSTSVTGRAIVADAARAVDGGLAARIDGCRSWRGGYIPLLAELTGLGAQPADALRIARAGVDSMRARLVVENGGAAVPLVDVSATAAPPLALGTGEIAGSAAPAKRLEVPYRGRMLHGEELRSQLARWSGRGIVEPSFAEAIERVAEHPEWLALPGRTVALVGAGAEIGPLGPLCAWGADVVAIDLPGDHAWERISSIAAGGAGTLRLPVAADGTPGVDVVADLAAAGAWLREQLAGASAVLGMYGYADGGAHVLLTGAFDALAADLLDADPATALAYLATPTDAYLAPADDVAAARAAYRARRLRALAQGPLKLISGGRLYRPAYRRGGRIADSLVEQQGPNYALAKRLQRWRGMLAAAEGTTVSFNVAPATFTRSVTKNRVLAAAYAGARHFGIEIFEPATTRVLMAAMLVHDLSAGRPVPPGEDLFAQGAAHGGLWTAAYEPRSALGLAALAGLPASTLRGGRR